MLHIYCKRYVTSRLIATLDPQTLPIPTSMDPIQALSGALTVQVGGDDVAIALTNVDEHNEVYVLTIPHTIALDMISEINTFDETDLSFHYIDVMDVPFFATRVAPNPVWRVDGPSSTTISSRLFRMLVHISTMTHQQLIDEGTAFHDVKLT